MEGCNEKKKKKNGEATEGKGSIVKHGEMLHEGKACENPVECSSSEYLVDARLYFDTKLQKYTSFAFR